MAVFINVVDILEGRFKKLLEPFGFKVIVPMQHDPRIVKDAPFVKFHFDLTYLGERLAIERAISQEEIRYMWHGDDDEIRRYAFFRAEQIIREVMLFLVKDDK